MPKARETSVRSGPAAAANEARPSASLALLQVPRGLLNPRRGLEGARGGRVGRGGRVSGRPAPFPDVLVPGFLKDVSLSGLNALIRRRVAQKAPAEEIEALQDARKRLLARVVVANPLLPRRVVPLYVKHHARAGKGVQRARKRVEGLVREAQARSDAAPEAVRQARKEAAAAARAFRVARRGLKVARVRGRRQGRLADVRLRVRRRQDARARAELREVQDAAARVEAAKEAQAKADAKAAAAAAKVAAAQRKTLTRRDKEVRRFMRKHGLSQDEAVKRVEAATLQATLAGTFSQKREAKGPQGQGRGMSQAGALGTGSAGGTAVPVTLPAPASRGPSRPFPASAPGPGAPVAAAWAKLQARVARGTLASQEPYRGGGAVTGGPGRPARPVRPAGPSPWGPARAVGPARAGGPGGLTLRAPRPSGKGLAPAGTAAAPVPLRGPALAKLQAALARPKAGRGKAVDRAYVPRPQGARLGAAPLGVGAVPGRPAGPVRGGGGGDTPYVSPARKDTPYVPKASALKDTLYVPKAPARKDTPYVPKGAAALGGRGAAPYVPKEAEAPGPGRPMTGLARVNASLAAGAARAGPLGGRFRGPQGPPQGRRSRGVHTGPGCRKGSEAAEADVPVLAEGGEGREGAEGPASRPSPPLAPSGPSAPRRRKGAARVSVQGVRFQAAYRRRKPKATAAQAASAWRQVRRAAARAAMVRGRRPWTAGAKAARWAAAYARYLATFRTPRTGRVATTRPGVPYVRYPGRPVHSTGATGWRVRQGMRQRTPVRPKGRERTLGVRRPRGMGPWGWRTWVARWGHQVLRPRRVPGKHGRLGKRAKKTVVKTSRAFRRRIAFTDVDAWFKATVPRGEEALFAVPQDGLPVAFRDWSQEEGAGEEGAPATAAPEAETEGAEGAEGAEATGPSPRPREAEGPTGPASGPSVEDGPGGEPLRARPGRASVRPARAVPVAVAPKGRPAELSLRVLFGPNATLVPEAGPKGPGAGATPARPYVASPERSEASGASPSPRRGSAAKGEAAMAQVRAWRTHRAGIPSLGARWQAVEGLYRKVPAHLWREVPMPPLPPAPVPEAVGWDVTRVYAPATGADRPQPPTHLPRVTRQGQRLPARARNALRYLAWVRRALRDAVGAVQRAAPPAARDGPKDGAVGPEALAAALAAAKAAKAAQRAHAKAPKGLPGGAPTRKAPEGAVAPAALPGAEAPVQGQGRQGKETDSPRAVPVAWAAAYPEAVWPVRVTDVTALLRAMPGVAAARRAFLDRGAKKYDHQARFAYGMAEIAKKHAAWRQEKEALDAYALQIKTFHRDHPENTRRWAAMKGKLLRQRLASQKALQKLGKLEDRLRATQFSVPKYRIPGYGKTPQKVLRALGASEPGGGTRWFGHLGHRARVSEVYAPAKVEAMRDAGFLEEAAVVGRWRPGEKEAWARLRAVPRAYAQQVDTLRKRACLEGRTVGRPATSPVLRPSRDAGIVPSGKGRGVSLVWWPYPALAEAWLARQTALYGEGVLQTPPVAPQGLLAAQKAAWGEKGAAAVAEAVAAEVAAGVAAGVYDPGSLSPAVVQGTLPRAPRAAPAAPTPPGPQGKVLSLAERLGVGPGAGQWQGRPSARPDLRRGNLAGPARPAGPQAPTPPGDDALTPAERVALATRWVVEVPPRRDVDYVIRGRGKAGPRLAKDHEALRRLYQQLRVTYGLRRAPMERWLSLAGSRDWWATVALLEARVDVVLWRLGFAVSLHAARRLVRQGWVLVNRRKVTRRAQLLRVGDSLAFVPAARGPLHGRLQEAYACGQLPPYLSDAFEVSWATLEAVMVQVPTLWYLPFQDVDVLRFHREVTALNTPVAAKHRRRHGQARLDAASRARRASLRGRRLPVPSALGGRVPRGKHRFGRWGKGGGAYRPTLRRRLDSVQLPDALPDQED